MTQKIKHKNQKSKKKDLSPTVPQSEKIDHTLNISHRQTLTEKQSSFLDLAATKECKIIILDGPAGTAKAQPLDSDVLTPKGWTKMGDIKPGMSVMGEDGREHTVISVHPQGIKDIYKIEFSDGAYCECTLDHLWKTQTSEDRNQRKKIKGKRYWSPPREGTIKTTAEILNSIHIRSDRLNHSIPITSPVEFEAKEHFLSPYIMGVLLGDGCFRVKSQIIFSNADKEIIDRLKKDSPKNTEIKKRSTSKYDYIIKCKISTEKDRIKEEIKRLNLDNLKSCDKFIPEEYLFDSVNNRIELLRGLMDSDGAVSKSGYYTTFTTTSKKLSIGIRFLVESLGGTCRETKHKNYYTYLNERKQGKDSYTSSICLDKINPFFLNRKKTRVIFKTKYRPSRYITNIAPVGPKECQCILVSNPSHLYLTNNFIVTHNTFMSVLAGLESLNSRKTSDIIYIRSAVESTESRIGFIPGSEAEKISPYLQPLVDKLHEFLQKPDIDYLLKNEKVSGRHTGYLRGLSWNTKFIILDEAQNASHKELVTALTRVGQFSKMIVIGDSMQNDINGKSGFKGIYDLFDDEDSRNNGIFCLKLYPEDIVRSGIVQYIVKKIGVYKT